MRGHDEQTNHMFRYLSPEQWGPADHPLRAVRALTDQALRSLSRRFASLYAQTERPSIPPEQWRRALVLQELYTVRSERLAYAFSRAALADDEVGGHAIRAGSLVTMGLD